VAAGRRGAGAAPGGAGSGAGYGEVIACGRAPGVDSLPSNAKTGDLLQEFGRVRQEQVLTTVAVSDSWRSGHSMLLRG
jgi:hypothetical protein